ncbi:hypothetical protein L345_04969, partial [Ophiophagus hannah]
MRPHEYVIQPSGATTGSLWNHIDNGYLVKRSERPDWSQMILEKRCPDIAIYKDRYVKDIENIVKVPRLLVQLHKPEVIDVITMDFQVPHHTGAIDLCVLKYKRVGTQRGIRESRIWYASQQKLNKEQAVGRCMCLERAQLVKVSMFLMLPQKYGIDNLRMSLHPCPLCEEAKMMLEPYKDKFTLEEIDITLPNHSVWLEKYKYEIPVFHLNGKFLMKHQFKLVKSSKVVDSFIFVSGLYCEISSLQQLKGKLRLSSAQKTDPSASNYFSGFTAKTNTGIFCRDAK